MASVLRLSARLRASIPRLDVLICNAGVGGVTGIDWVRAAWRVPLAFVRELTWPSYKVSGVGWLVGRQERVGGAGGNRDGDEKKSSEEKGGIDETEGKEEVEEDPPLGMVFASNVLGHYVLGHELAPLMLTTTTTTTTTTDDSKSSGVRPETTSSLSERRRAKIVWVSSLEAYAHSFAFGPGQSSRNNRKNDNSDDIQGLSHTLAYESSKRLTDMLVLTSECASVRGWVRRYFSTDTNTNKEHTHNKSNTSNTSNSNTNNSGNNSKDVERLPRLYLTHPGVCATSIVSLPFALLQTLMTLAFYVARWLGSPWHTVDAYVGAGAVVWVALAGTTPKAIASESESAKSAETSESSESSEGESTSEPSESEPSEPEKESDGPTSDSPTLRNPASNPKPSISKRHARPQSQDYINDINDDNDDNDNDSPAQTVKWGSSTDRHGRLVIRATEVEGWGCGHDVSHLKGENEGGNGGGEWEKEKEEKEAFEELGWQCWREMERMRVEWTGRVRKGKRVNE